MLWIEFCFFKQKTADEMRISDRSSDVCSSDLINSLLAAAAASQAATNQSPANDDLVAEVRALREEVEQLRSDNNAGHAANAGNTGAIKRHLDNVTSASGGDTIATVVAA